MEYIAWTRKYGSKEIHNQEKRSRFEGLITIPDIKAYEKKLDSFQYKEKIVIPKGAILIFFVQLGVLLVGAGIVYLAFFI